ncbi:MAG: hypothetical protein JNM84_02750 [Planctomycetes bacterium]|nr:hypothetical protein [Planctomycetota bacterium]
MRADDAQAILLEILRVGLIPIRNLSEQPARSQLSDEKIRHWATLCHSLPAVLLGGCSTAPVSYFINGDLKSFCSSYPAQRDADFCQIVMLRAELDAALPDSEHQAPRD